MKILILIISVFCTSSLLGQKGFYISAGAGLSKMYDDFQLERINLPGLSMSLDIFYKIDRSELGLSIQKLGRIKNERLQDLQWGSFADHNQIIFTAPFYQNVTNISYHSFMLSYQYEWLRAKRFSVTSGMELGYLKGRESLTRITSEGNDTTGIFGFQQDERAELANNFQLKALYSLTERSSIGIKAFYGRPLEFYNIQLVVQARL